MIAATRVIVIRGAPLYILAFTLRAKLENTNTMEREELERKEKYDALHKEDQLRFPLEDYRVFYSWLNVPGAGQGLRLLDIACGQGFFLREAEEAGELSCYGIDFSPVAFNLARERLHRTELKQCSAYALPFDDDFFDYCVNLGSLEHFDAPEKALGELRRVLKPNGKALIIVPNQYYLGTMWKVFAYGEDEDQGQEGLTNFRTIKSWNGLFLRCGLDITGVKGYNGEHHINWFFRRPDGKVSEQEKQWRTFLNEFIKPAIPLNLSQCFVFTVRRQP
jgi:SAM-dependent methyltransferase